jgi:hypothetical protein
MTLEDFPRLKRQGQSVMRGGYVRPWDPDDLQSFSPLRFAPPTMMGFSGRAVVTDPDCFALGDVTDLFGRDMKGKAVMAVPRPGHGGESDYIATSVMLLDNPRLRHWDFDRQIDDLFAHRFDYLDWVALKREQRSTVGLLEPGWNSFDRLDDETEILHTTKRRTQPWKTGLLVDYTLRESGPFDTLRRLVHRRYQPHPDPNQEALIYSLLAEMLDRRMVTTKELVAEMAADHIRHDSLELIERHRGWNLVEQAA